MRSHRSVSSAEPESSLSIHGRLTVANSSVDTSARCVIRYLVFALLLLVPSVLVAQQSSAINGAVTDPSGAAIQNATVTLANTGQGTHISVVTNTAGEYSIPGLEAGTYNLEITAQGFQ